MIGAVSWVADVDTHLSYLRKVVLRRNPHFLHRDAVSIVRSGPEICEYTGGQNFVGNIDLFCYSHRIRQLSTGFSKFSQCDEESLFLSGLEVAFHDALARFYEVAKGDNAVVTHVV